MKNIFELFDEKGKKAGYFEVLLWIVDNYLEDIFVLENPEFLEIRDRARKLLIKNKYPLLKNEIK